MTLRPWSRRTKFYHVGSSIYNCRAIKVLSKPTITHLMKMFFLEQFTFHKVEGEQAVLTTPNVTGYKSVFKTWSKSVSTAMANSLSSAPMFMYSRVPGSCSN